jgi:Tol biopolymer transport system component
MTLPSIAALSRGCLWSASAIFIAVAALCGLAPGAEPSASGEASFLANARQLTFDGARAGEGYFHPDGNLLAFQSEREPGNPFYQIYLLDLLSGESARLSPGNGKTTCAFFQAGSGRVLFSSTHLDPKAVDKQKEELEFRASGKQRRYAWDYDESYEIFSANQDGTQLQQITNSPGYDAEGSYSPDGRQIVFCSMRTAYPRGSELPPEDRARREKDPAYFGDIYIMDSDGTDVRRLTEAPGYDGGPFFSPDGSRIIWRHFDESGMFADIWTMRTDGSDKRRLTDFGCMSWAPYYHPSGKYVIFTANKLGFDNFELFMVDVNGEREPVRITHTDGFDGLPVFSPEGTRLCWTSNRTSDKKSQLFLADWSHESALKALEAASVRQPRTTKSDQPAAPKISHIPAAAIATQESAPKDGLKFESAIREADLRGQIEWLASPERGGRMTGTPGAEAAAGFIADYFAKHGLKGIGTGFLQSFEFDAGVELIPNQNRLVLGADRAFELDKDWKPLAFSDTGRAEAEVVFAGYGLSVPEGQNGMRYNSYDGLDVKDKIVVVLRYVPEDVEPQRRAQLNRYAGLRYKAMLARERGAKAVLFVAGPNSAHPGELIPLSGDGSLAGSGVIAASITEKVADELLKSAGKTLKELQTALDTENPHVEGSFLVKDAKIQLETGVKHIKRRDNNVVAYIPPADNSAPPAPRIQDPHADPHAANSGANPHVIADPHALPPRQGKPAASTGPEFILLGAHYDHLGDGKGSNSLAGAGEEGKPHVGADDNASGVALLLEVAAALAEEREKHPEKFRRGVIFGLWSGEEIGLIGSSAFSEKPPLDLGSVAAYLNFDMVGRLRDNKLSLQGIGSSTVWRRMIEKRNVAAGFSLALQDDPYLPTDTTAFYPRRIPVLNFFTGSHEDYHRPTDTPDKINYSGTERIATFAKQLVLDLVSAPERPDFARVERTTQNSGSRETLRAYMGTIPDYATDVKGVKFSGVRGGSPAEKAGVKGGDVLIEFAGQKIVNIYDYTYALDAVKIGQPVKVVVERGGERVELTVTPEARK